MPKCDFNKVSLLNLLHIFKTPFLKNSYGGLLLNMVLKYNSRVDNSTKNFFFTFICDNVASYISNCLLISRNYPANIYFFKVNNRNTRKRCESQG